MKLSDYTGEKAFAVVADLMGPLSKIATSEKFKAEKIQTKLDLAAAILRADVGAAREMLAILMDVSVLQYHPTGAELMNDILEAVSDEAFVALFLSPRQKKEENPSQSVSANAGA